MRKIERRSVVIGVGSGIAAILSAAAASAATKLDPTRDPAELTPAPPPPKKKKKPSPDLGKQDPRLRRVPDLDKFKGIRRG
jgi:hypothetical protein